LPAAAGRVYGRTMGLDAFWVALLVKMAATVSVVLLAAVAAERGGPFWGGLSVRVPLASGPGYVLLALDHDAQFIADSALNSVAGTSAANLFLLAIVRLAPRRAALPTLAIAVTVWFVAAAAVRQVAWTTPTAVLANAATLALGWWLTRDAVGVPVGARAARRWLDLPLRAIAVAALVGGVVTASTTLGPGLTGIVVVFPITLLSMAAIVHARLGGPVAAATMAHGLRAMPGFSAAILTLHLLAPSGVVRALICGLAASLAYVFAMMAWRRYRAALASASSQRRNSATLPSSASASRLTHQ